MHSNSELQLLPRFCSPAPPGLTCDGDRSMCFLPQEGVLHQAAVSTVGLEYDPQDALHVKEALFVGHLRGGDVLGDVVALAILPYHCRFRITKEGVTGHRYQVPRLQILVGFQVQTGLGVGS